MQAGPRSTQAELGNADRCIASTPDRDVMLLPRHSVGYGKRKFGFSHGLHISTSTAHRSLSSCNALPFPVCIVRYLLSISMCSWLCVDTSKPPLSSSRCTQPASFPTYPSFPFLAPQDTINSINSVAATSLLLSIKHTTDDGELYASHGHARGGVGVLLATGTSRGSISRLPQAAALAKKQSQRMEGLRKLEASSDPNALSLGLEQAGQSRWDIMGLHQVRDSCCYILVGT